MKTFILYWRGYWKCQREAISFCGTYWWLMDGAGFVQLVFLIFRSLFGWPQFEDSAMNYFIVVISVVFVLAVFALGPFIMAYRAHLKSEEDKNRLEEEKRRLEAEKESLLKHELDFSVERMSCHVLG